MKNQAVHHFHMQMRKDHKAASSPVSCLLSWVQKQYCSGVRKKKKENINELQWRSQRTAEPDKPHPISQDSLQENSLAISNKTVAFEEYNCSVITKDTLGKTAHDG